MNWRLIARTTSGAAFAGSTTTLIVCEALSPPGSRAVTVTVAVPSATAWMVAVPPDTETVATPVLELVAVEVSASPFGSLKKDATLTDGDSPTTSIRAGIVPVAAGGWLGAGGGSTGPGSPPPPSPQVAAHSAASTTEAKLPARRQPADVAVPAPDSGRPVVPPLEAEGTGTPTR